MRVWQRGLAAFRRRRLLLVWGIVLLLGVGVNWRGWWGQLLGNVGVVRLNQAYAAQDEAAQERVAQERVAQERVALERAIGHLAEAAAFVPGQRLLTLLGTAWQKQGQPDAAAIYWRQLPDPVPYLHLWGDHYWAESAYGAAAGWYQQAVDLAPAEAYNHYLLGLAQQKAGRLAAAQASFLAAQARLPDDGLTDSRLAQSDLLFQLTNVSLLLAEPDWADVLAQLDRAIALDDFGSDLFVPAQTHYLRGEALRALTRYQEAAAAYEQAFTVLPGHYLAYVRLGNLAAGPLRDLAYAETLFQTAISVDGTRVPAYLGLGDVYERSDRAAAAAAVYQQVLQLEPDNARAAGRLRILLPPAQPPAPASDGE